MIAFAAQTSLSAVAVLAWDVTLRTGLFVAIAMVSAGLSDYAFQRWRMENQLKMSKQELKDERKQDEGDPLIRARIKRVQREMAQNRMLRDVPTASVILTNPTHYAIAIKYDTATMSAPRVVAKGVDEVAKRIREIAGEHDIPILERPSLARTLYKSVEVGHDIPPDLYRALAEIVAYLYRLGRWR